MGDVALGKAPDSGAIVVAESRQQFGMLFSFLALASGVAGVRGVAGPQATAGRVAIAIICGLLIVAFIARLIVMIRHPSRLEVTGDAIRYVQRDGHMYELSRQDGDRLRFVQRHRGGRMWTLELTIADTDAVIVLRGFFSRNAVRQACRARGWRFDDQVSRIR